MHDYSVDTKDRIKIIAILGILSVTIKILINEQIKKYAPFIEPVDTLFIFSALFSLYNFFLWKLAKFIPFLGYTPNFNGTYEGELFSSHHNYKEPIPAQVTVKQTWTKMLITLKTGTSKSCSKTGSIVTKTKCDPTLLYFYQNDPNVDSDKSMEIHYGTCEHTWDKDKNSFNASYYSGRGRKTDGIIKLKKVKKSALNF